MPDRFSKLTKVPADPAAKLLAQDNVKLATQLDAPASASVEAVLIELDAKGANVDLLRLLSIALPPRERVWWACLAGRDVPGPTPGEIAPSLAASEAWVFKPTPENRVTAVDTIDLAYIDDETVNCAIAVMYADGTLGPGDLANHPAPAGAAEAAAFAMNVVALGEHSDKYEEYGQLLVDRAVDIARGGNGRLNNNKQAEEA